MKNFYCVLILFLKITNYSGFSFDPSPANIIPEECKKDCITPYGSVIGTFSGVKSFSNCNDNCSNFDDAGVYFNKVDTGFSMDVYVGVRWQCVEYARRFLIVNKQVSFKSIDYAYNIFDLDVVSDLSKENSYLPFESFKNRNSNPPQVGDLIIYPKSKLNPYGHVAIVSGINIVKGYIEIAEQNINSLWEDQSAYSRRIVMLNSKDAYIVTDAKWHKDLTVNELINLVTDEHNAIGWKRVLDK